MKTVITPTLHPNNKHQGKYDFNVLIDYLPALKDHVFRNKYNTLTIDFSNPEAVKALNKALLLKYYRLDYWDIPTGYLTPPIPSRAEYIHQVAGLFAKPYGKRCIDIGVGANAIYPIVGIAEYQWNFVGTEIDKVAMESIEHLIEKNKLLRNKITLRPQLNSDNIFEGIITGDEFFDLAICNPPFHSSAEEASQGTARKNRNLKKSTTEDVSLNFGGQSKELWCEGGELAFISQMILQSKKFSNQCQWFTTLVAKEKHLKVLVKNLKKTKPMEIKVLPINIGNKTSRILAWTFIKEEFVPKPKK